MNQRAKKIVSNVIRWGIAIVGFTVVIWNMNLRDRVLLLNPTTNLVAEAVLAEHAEEDANQFDVIDPQTGHPERVGRPRLLNPPTQKRVRVRIDGKEQDVALLGMDLEGDLNRNPTVKAL